MPKFRFKKLVRDKIVDKQIQKGSRPKYRLLAPDEHRKELIRKITEEALEILGADQTEIASEIADVQQAIDDLKLLMGLSGEDIIDAQRKKKQANGTFERGVYIDYVETDDGDEWNDYFRNNSDRYPEIK